MTTGFLEKAGQFAKKQVEKKIEEAPKEIKTKVEQNLWGRVCTWAIKDEKNANRCKALERLPDIAKDGTAAFGSCMAAETGVGALSCAYYSAKTADSTGAMTHQLATGEETKTLQEQGEDYGMEKAKELGAAVKKRYDKAVDDLAFELQNSELRNAQKADPDLTADEFNRANDAWENFGR